MAAHTQPQPGYAAPGYTPSQRKSDPLLVVMGVLFILVGLVPLVWVFLLRAPMGQWIWLRQFLDSFYFVDSNRFVGSACVLLLLGVPGVILLIKGLRR